MITPFVEDVWIDTAPVRILRTRLSVSMTVMRLEQGGLLVHSPLEPTPERRAAIQAIGSVEHLYAPNLFHHLHLGAWATAFPRARVHALRGLAKKRPDLRIDRAHDEGPDADLTATFEELHVEGSRLGETVLFHRSARTLVVADLVHNVGAPRDPWSKLYTRLAGFHDRVVISRVLRWTAFPDREAAAASVNRILGLPFERVVVGHGQPIATHAKDALRAAWGWLPGVA